MQIINEILNNNGARLRGYIQDTSLEMSHLNTRPAVLILPGGSYRYCTDKEAEPVALAYVQKGFNAFVLEYTVMGSKVTQDNVFDKAYNDVREAFIHIKENAFNYHIDDKQISIIGFDAGGHLAAAFGTFEKEKPASIILGYPSIKGLFYNEEKVNAPNILENIKNENSPTFMFTTQGNTVISSEETLSFAIGLAKNKVPYELHVFAEGEHGLSLSNDIVWDGNNKANKTVEMWLDLSVNFINKCATNKLATADYSSVNFGIDMPISQIFSDVRTASIFEKYLPGLRKKLDGTPVMTAMSINKVANFSKGMISDEKLKALDKELKEVGESLNRKETMEKYTAIYPGKVWLDTKGKRIEAHGGAMYYENGTYYWYGENKEKTDGKNGIWTYGIRAYSSKDLYNWEDEGLIIPPDLNNTESSLYPDKCIDRPHIVKSKKTGKYVCWIKLSGESACFAILSSDNILGPYKMEKNKFFPNGQKAGDFDVVEDEREGKVYLLSDINHEAVVTYELTEDCLDIAKEVTRQYVGLYPPFVREGVSAFERQGKKYMLTSGLTGYIPNASDTAVSDSYRNAFVSLGNPHITDDSKSSFNSQISKVFKVEGKKDLYIAMADRWVPEYIVDGKRADKLTRAIATRYAPDKYQATKEDQMELMNSPMLSSANTSLANYVWLPIKFKGDKVIIDWYDQWKLEDFE